MSATPSVSPSPSASPSAPPLPASSGPVIGIDVAKAHVDVAVLSPASVTPGHRPAAGETFRCATTVAGLGALVTRLDALTPAPALVVLEASGGYERPVLAALWAADLPVAVVNPRRVRWFARSAGYGAKTDRLDAGVLAHYGLVLRPRPQAAPPARLEQLRHLVRRREQVVAMRAAERQRAHQWKRADATIHADCLAHIATLTTDIDALERRIAALVADDPDLAGLIHRLRSVPGVGPIVAATLVACLPELGRATDKELAALAGLAPYSRESGQWQGSRHISGGRPAVRRVLYLAIVRGRSGCPALGALDARLREAGKPPKVALVACARKLLVILNTLVRDGTTWVDRTAESAATT